MGLGENHHVHRAYLVVSPRREPTQWAKSAKKTVVDRHSKYSAMSKIHSYRLAILPTGKNQSPSFSENSVFHVRKFEFQTRLLTIGLQP